MGVLDGVRIVEMAGIGPSTFAAMMLADHGATVIRVERLGGAPVPIDMDTKRDALLRGRPAIEVDLKSAAGLELVRSLARGSDAIIEGYRPGVMERLGLGPSTLLSDNLALVYGRMTGWGQEGPNALVPGHDINYLALSGTLHMLGRRDAPPYAPANLLGDYGGGGLLLAFGVCAAIIQARSSGRGQVVDCAMVDGAAILATLMWSLHAQDRWKDERASNFLDGGAHFYDSYRTSDDRFVAIGAIEPPFYQTLCRIAGFDDPLFESQFDPSVWPALKEKVAAVIATKTRDEWCALLEHTDACVTPVLSMAEAPHHPQSVARRLFEEVDGVTQPAPAPRFAATPAAPLSRSTDGIGATLSAFGIQADKVDDLRTAGALVLP